MGHTRLLSPSWVGVYTSSSMGAGSAVIVERVPTATAAVGVWMQVGSAVEPGEQAGITHLVEHLLLRRCGARTPEAIAQLIDSLGGQVDAFTTREVCAVTAHVPSNRKEEALALLLDAVFAPRFVPEDVAIEKGVVAAEFEVIQDSPAEVAAEKALMACWGAHPLARPVLGFRETVANLQCEHLQSFHRRFFGQQHALLVAVGDWEEPQLERLWTSLPKAEESVKTLEAPAFVPRLEVEERAGLEQVYVHLTFPGLAARDVRLPTLAVLDQLLGSGNSSRLFRELRDRLGLVYEVQSSLYATAAAGVLEVSFAAPASRATRAWDAFLGVLEAVSRGHIAPWEVDLAKQALCASVVLGTSSPDALLEAHAGEFLARGRRFSGGRVEEEIKAVRLEDVQKMASQLLSLEWLAGAVCGPPGGLGIPESLLAKVA